MEVALFITCLTDTYFPRTGEAVVRVLRHYGCRVVFPAGQTCCGQPAFNSGFRADAVEVARHTLDVFAPHDVVVTPSASCAVMIKHHFADLFADDPVRLEAAKRLAARTHEFMDFVCDVLGVDVAAVLRAALPAAPERVSTTYHFACHSRELCDAKRFAARLGADEADSAIRSPNRPDLCCGFGGMFAVDYPEVSAAMLTDKLDALRSADAERIICNEAGCGLHIVGGARRRGETLRLKHVAELMAESLGLMIFDESEKPA